VLPSFDKIRVIESILGKTIQAAGRAVDASGLGGNCDGSFETAILGLAAILLIVLLELVLNSVVCCQF